MGVLHQGKHNELYSGEIQSRISNISLIDTRCTFWLQVTAIIEWIVTYLISGYLALRDVTLRFPLGTRSPQQSPRDSMSTMNFPASFKHRRFSIRHRTTCQQHVSNMSSTEDPQRRDQMLKNAAMLDMTSITVLHGYVPLQINAPGALSDHLQAPLPGVKVSTIPGSWARALRVAPPLLFPIGCCVADIE
eukprot:9486354-Pyramimonas_sp.AAC.1